MKDELMERLDKEIANMEKLFADPTKLSDVSGYLRFYKALRDRLQSQQWVRVEDDLPDINKGVVLAWHPEWVDEDYCSDGIREAFVYDDGTLWQSAKWDGYSDQWIVDKQEPLMWMPKPTPTPPEDKA